MAIRRLFGVSGHHIWSPHQLLRALVFFRTAKARPAANTSATTPAAPNDTSLAKHSAVDSRPASSEDRLRSRALAEARRRQAALAATGWGDLVPLVAQFESYVFTAPESARGGRQVVCSRSTAKREEAPYFAKFGLDALPPCG